MNPDSQLDALLRAARDSAPDTSRAEHAFETRLAARLREEPGLKGFTLLTPQPQLNGEEAQFTISGKPL